MMDQFGTHRLSLGRANEFHLAMTESDHNAIDFQLFENPETSHNNERGVLCVITRSSGDERVSFLVHDVVDPEDVDVDYPAGKGVQFSADYRRAAKDRAKEVEGEAGLLYLHTHPTLDWWNSDDSRPTVSDGDIRTSRRDLHHDAKQLSGDDCVPLAIGIVKDDSREWMVLGHEFETPSEADQLDEAAYSSDSGRTYYADAVRIVGSSGLTEKPAGGSGAGVAGASAPIDTVPVESTANLWGKPAQKRVGALRVGLVGLGGGGSILAEHLARMGVGELVLVDFDHLERANLNRAQGASKADADARLRKTEVAGRLARLAATADHFRAREEYASVVESRVEYGALDSLVDCDIIVHAAEGDWPTQVLDLIAHAHLIPVVNGGSNLLNDDGVLTDKASVPTMVSGPGNPCLRCGGYWDPERADDESEGEDVGENNYGLDTEVDDERDPSTNSVNLVAAGMMLLRLQDYVLGVTDDTVGINEFLPGKWEFRKGLGSCEPSCRPKEAMTKGDSERLPLAPDPEFAKQRR